MRCKLCSRDTQDRRFQGTHWLCGVHRRAACVERLGGATKVSEYALLRGLVFDFPDSCERDEALARAYYVSETWHLRDKSRVVLRAHRMLGRVAATCTATPHETLELVTEFTAFVLRHAGVIAQTEAHRTMLVATCATKVAQWYPMLIRPVGIRELMRAERVVSLIWRETGRRLFLVKADVVLGLASLPLDVAERIYLAYVARISLHATLGVMMC
jgi:hypothetical protein